MEQELPTNSEKTGYGNPPKEYQFKPGQSGNPSGRPKGTMKDYLRRKFMELSDEEKEVFLKEHKVAGIDQIKLAEGNPAQGIEHSGEITEKQYIIQRGTSNDQPVQTSQDASPSDTEQPQV